ncbi:MAG TPA: hypothetical protein VIY26_03680 [Acidimicrobiales bacterium]
MRSAIASSRRLAFNAAVKSCRSRCFKHSAGVSSVTVRHRTDERRLDGRPD